MPSLSKLNPQIQDVVGGLRKDRYGGFYVIMLKAAVDDSGSGGDSPWYVLAGYVASVEDWIAFEAEWRAVLDSEPGIEYFKSSEAESRKGQFAGFTEAARNARVDALIDVIQRRVRRAIHVRVRQKHYNRIIRSCVPAKWDDAYFFLFPAFISAAVAAEKHFGADEPIEFVFDSHQRFERPSTRLYAGMQQMASWAGRIANVSYRDEKQFLPLQAADLLAWQVRRRFSTTGERERPQYAAAQKCAAEAPCFGYTLTERDLHRLLATMRREARRVAADLGLRVDEEQPWNPRER